VVRDHLGSMGFGQELRVLFHLQRAGWGGAGLMRATGSRAFREDETIVEATPASNVWLQRRRASDRGHAERPAVIAAVDANAVAGRTVSQRARPADAAWLVLRGHLLVPGGRL